LPVKAEAAEQLAGVSLSARVLLVEIAR